MRDEETGTEWSQLLCKGMKGQFSGTTLKVIPSSLTAWKTWKKNHPDTTVIQLRRTGVEFKTNFYKDPSRFVIGLADNEQSIAWTFDKLMESPVVNDQFNGESIVVFFEPLSGAAHVFDRTIDGVPQEFELKDGVVVDKSTHSTWNSETGVANSGKLKGRSLKPLPGIPSFKSSWLKFYPNSEMRELNTKRSK